MNKTVGLIGVGIMGKLMISKWQEAGYTVFAMDNSEAAKAHCKENGVVVCETKAELVEKTDKIVLCLPSPKISIAVATELAEVAGENTIVMETSTLSPDYAKEIKAIFDGSKGSFVEGCILGRPSMIGKWTIIAGGDADKVAAMEDAMLQPGERVVHSGPVGTANAIKVLNNTMFCIFNAAVCEVFVAAENAGVDHKAFYEIVANSQAATNSGVFREIAKKIVDGSYDQPNATLDIAAKDNACGKDLAKSVGLSLTMTNAALAAFENAQTAGLGQLDSAALYTYLRNVYPTIK